MRSIFIDRNSMTVREASSAPRTVLQAEASADASPDFLDRLIRIASRRGIVTLSGGIVHPATFSVDDYDRDRLKRHFLAALGGAAWVDRSEAIRRFAGWLGFRRAGPRIVKVGKSLINGLLRDGRLEKGGGLIRRV